MSEEEKRCAGGRPRIRPESREKILNNKILDHLKDALDLEAENRKQSQKVVLEAALFSYLLDRGHFTKLLRRTRRKNSTDETADQRIDRQIRELEKCGRVRF